MPLRQKNSGYTPVEILIVVGVIIILNVALWIIIEPATHFAKARDIQREVHSQILSGAIQQYSMDHKGQLIPGIDSSLKMIGAASAGCRVACGKEWTEETCLDLSGYLAGVYLSYILYDPEYGSPEKTYYAVKIGPSQRIVVRACGAEK